MFGMLRPDCFPLTFREAAVGRREGEAWHRLSLDFMGDGREERETGVPCRGLDPLRRAAWASPGRRPGLDPGGSLTDEQEHRSGSRRLL